MDCNRISGRRGKMLPAMLALLALILVAAAAAVGGSCGWGRVRQQALVLSQQKKKTRQDDGKSPRIPLVLYKTGPFAAGEIPSNIQDHIDISCRMLGATLHYFDDRDCRRHIETHFDSSVLKAYDSLIPTAFKADLWRFCILYTNGGIYGDLSQKVLVPYDVNANRSDMILTRDRGVCCSSTDNIQISFMASVPRNPILKYIIDRTSQDILDKKMGRCSLDITGPVAFRTYICQFLGVPLLQHGVHTYQSTVNKQSYTIDVAFQMINGFLSFIDNTDHHFLKTKADNHEKMLYKSVDGHYDVQYKNNQVYRE